MNDEPEEEPEEEMVPIKRTPSQTCPTCDRPPAATARGPKGVTYTCRGGHTWGPGVG